jgi:hypothetical protein
MGRWKKPMPSCNQGDMPTSIGFSFARTLKQDSNSGKVLIRKRKKTTTQQIDNKNGK